MPRTTNLLREVSETESQTDFTAVESLWNILVRAALSKSHKNEFRRLQLLITDLNSTQVIELMRHPSIDTLLNIQPPLERILTDQHERLQPEKIVTEFATIRAERIARPAKAAESLLGVLKRIRNKRIHGFKTPDGPRDTAILGATRLLLKFLCDSLVH